MAIFKNLGCFGPYALHEHLIKMVQHVGSENFLALRACPPYLGSRETSPVPLELTQNKYVKKICSFVWCIHCFNQLTMFTRPGFDWTLKRFLVAGEIIYIKAMMQERRGQLTRWALSLRIHHLSLSLSRSHLLPFRYRKSPKWMQRLAIAAQMVSP